MDISSQYIMDYVFSVIKKTCHVVQLCGSVEEEKKKSVRFYVNRKCLFSGFV